MSGGDDPLVRLALVLFELMVEAQHRVYADYEEVERLAEKFAESAREWHLSTSTQATATAVAHPNHETVRGTQ